MALLSEYGFNEGSGASTSDSSGNNRDLTAINNPGSWSSNAKNGAYAANGHSFHGVLGPNQAQTEYTAMAWVYVAGGAGDTRTIIGGGTPPPLVAHGKELPATSDLAEQVVGLTSPVGSLTPIAARQFTNGEVIENCDIGPGQSTIATGARVIFRNCRFYSAFGSPSGAYTLRITNGGGCYVTLENCLLIMRGGNSKCLVAYDDSNIEAKRCVFRGGTDNAFFGTPHTPGLIPTGDSLAPNARILVEESWFGDIETVPGGHKDCIQLDRGGSFAVFRRNRVMAFTIPEGSDTLTTRVTNPSTAPMASTCMIATSVSDEEGPACEHVSIRDCWFDGGNYNVQFGGHPGPFDVTNNEWGLRGNFAPLLPGSQTTRNDNVWGESGIPTHSVMGGAAVTAGDPIPGES